MVAMRKFGIDVSREKGLPGEQPMQEDPSLDTQSAEHDRLVKDHDEVLREREVLLSEREEIVHEHKEMQRAREELLRENARLQGEIRRLEALVRARQEPAPAPLPEEPTQDRSELLERVADLEGELESYRSQPERATKMLLSAMDYAESVRERARRDAQVMLRKARSRAQQILDEREHRLQDAERDFLRLQELSRETRTRLSAFTTAALEVLNAEIEADEEPAFQEDLREALQSEVASVTSTPPANALEPVTSVPAPVAHESQPVAPESQPVAPESQPPPS
jgi:cell division septum initiation protein DivIVA